MSVGSEGVETAGLEAELSARGRIVAFTSLASNLVRGDTNGVSIFVHSRRSKRTKRVTLALQGRRRMASAAAPGPTVGRFVPFHSLASNFLVGGDTNGTFDVFVHDRETGRTRA